VTGKSVIHIEDTESAEKERRMAVAALPGFGLSSLFTPEVAKTAQKNTKYVMSLRPLGLWCEIDQGCDNREKHCYHQAEQERLARGTKTSASSAISM
jgi:hypothetical protein